MIKMGRTIATIGLALALVCGCWTTSKQANETTSESLSAKERMEVFETVWKTINDEYYNYNQHSLTGRLCVNVIALV